MEEKDRSCDKTLLRKVFCEKQKIASWNAGITNIWQIVKAYTQFWGLI